MDKNSPEISCILPLTSFDSFSCIAIESVLNQSFSDFELLLLCNNMELHDFDLFKKKYSDYINIRFFYLNLPGLSFALNYGLNESRGKFIARMDDDDFSFPDRFLLQYKFLVDNPEYCIVGCRVNLIDFDSNTIGSFPFVESHKKIIKFLPYRNTLCHPALMFRKDTLLKIGGYKFGFMSEDHELFLRVSMVDGNLIHNLDKVLFNYRRHHNQITDSSNRKKHFAEISSFLFLYFLKTKNLKFIFGIFWVLPFIRSLKDLIKRFSKQ